MRLIITCILATYLVACQNDLKPVQKMEMRTLEILNDSKFRVNPKIYAVSNSLNIVLFYIDRTNYYNQPALRAYSAYLIHQLCDSFPIRELYDTVSVRIYVDTSTNLFWQTDYDRNGLDRSNSNFDKSPTLKHLVEYCMENMEDEEFIACDSALNRLHLLPIKYKLGLENYRFNGGLMDLLLVHAFECDDLYNDVDSIAYKGIHGLYFFYGVHPVENIIFRHMQNILAQCGKTGYNPKILDSIRTFRRQYSEDDESGKRL